MASEDKNRRHYFRLEYPQFLRPTIEVNDGYCEVVEISEAGVRLRTSGWPHPLGAELIARIHFNDGSVHNLENAEVLRLDEHEVVLSFTGGVSMKRMALEQRKIVRASILDGNQEMLALLRRPK